MGAAGRPAATATPVSIVLHARTRALEIAFEDGQSYRIPFELMRVYSPSAEVQGHGPGQEVLQTGKRDVEVTAMLPVGNYAVQPRFSDGHDSGIFTWEYLRHLGEERETLWAGYLRRLESAGAHRDTPMPSGGTGHACGH